MNDRQASIIEFLVHLVRRFRVIIRKFIRPFTQWQSLCAIGFGPVKHSGITKMHNMA